MRVPRTSPASRKIVGDRPQSTYRSVSQCHTLWLVVVDWSYRGDYIAARHGVSAKDAEQALADPDALVFDPDYASLSGRSARTIGWSPSAQRLLTVITLADGEMTFGVNAWPANDGDARRYNTDHQPGDDDEQ